MAWLKMMTRALMLQPTSSSTICRPTSTGRTGLSLLDSDSRPPQLSWPEWRVLMLFLVALLLSLFQLDLDFIIGGKTCLLAARPGDRTLVPR